MAGTAAAISFSNTENVTGGSEKDTFLLDGQGIVTGSVTGGAGIEEIVLFDAVRITGDMTFSRTTTSVTVGGSAVPVTLTTVGLASGSVFIGSGAGTAGESGFTATISDLIVALATETSGARSWLAVDATLTGASLSGVDLLGLLGPSALTVEVNGKADDGSFVDWSGAPVTVSGSSRSIDYATPLLRATALGVSVDVGDGVLSASADVVLERREVDVDVNGAGTAGGELVGAVLLTFTLSNFSASSSFGIAVSGGSLTVARLTPSASDVAGSDERAWTAVSGTGLAASIRLGDVLTASVSSLVVEVNTASGTGATPLDWATVITSSPPVSLTASDVFTVEGDLTNVSLADLIGGGAHFSVVQTVVDVTAPALTGARLLVFTLSSLALSSPFGLSITSGSITFASLTPSAADVTGGDARRWSAISLTGLDATLSLGGALSAAVTGLTVTVNSASGAGATRIDWTGVPGSGVTLTPTDVFAVSGTISSLSIADVIGGSGSFSVTRSIVDVAAPALDDARLLRVELTGLTLSSSFGLSLTIGTLTVATLQPSADAVLAGDTRKWSALSITGAGATLQLGGAVSAAVTGLTVKVNSASGVGALPIDWTAVTGSGVPLTASDTYTVSGTISSLSIADVIGGAGSFSIARSVVDVATPALDDARLLVVSLTGLTLTSSFGLSLGASSVTVATLQPSAADVLAGDTRKWSALVIDDAGGSLQLGGALSATVSLVDVQVNSFSGALGATPAAAMDWTGVTGSTITGAVAAFSLTGTISSLSIADVIGGAGSFSIARNVVDVTTPALDDARLLVVSLTGLTLSSSFGLSLSVTGLTVATLQPSAAAVLAGDTRKWSALVIDNAGGSLQLGGALSATVGDVDVQVNSFSGAGATAMDWTGVTGSTITGAVAAFALSGTISSLSIADVIGGAGSFSIAKSTVNVATPALTGARLLVFNLTGLTLSSSFGVSVNVATLSVATLQPSAADVLAGDTRKWSALVIDNAGGSLQLGGALNATVTDVDVQVNSFSGAKATTLAAAMDWTGVTGSGITAAIADFSLSGTISSLSIADVIGGAGSFSITKSTVDVTTPSLDDARLLVFNLTGLTLSSSFGVSINVTSLTVATLQPSAAAVLAGDTRKWSALVIDDAGGSLQLGGALNATVTNVDVQVNSFSGAGATAMNWTGVAGSGITTAIADFSLSGTISSLSIADVIGGAGSFSIAKSTVNVTTPALTDARLLVFNLTGLTLSSSFGVSVNVATLSVATLQPSAADVIAGDTRKWSALVIDNAGGSLQLGGALNATVTDVDVQVNSFSGAKAATLAAAMDWTGVTGSGITTAIAAFSLSGTISSLSIADVIGGAGSFSIAKSTVDVTTPALDDARLLVFNLTGLTLSSTFGVSVNVASLTVATLQPSATDVIAGDTRKWSALVIDNAGGSLQLGGALNATVTDVDVQVNSFSGAKATTLAAAMDWTGVAGSGIPAAIADFSLSGTISSLSIADVIGGSGSFSITKSTVNVVAPALTNARLLTFSLTGLTFELVVRRLDQRDEPDGRDVAAERGRCDRRRHAQVVRAGDR